MQVIAMSSLPVMLNRALVRPVERAGHHARRRLDAIVVPTVRPARNLRFAAGLAGQTGALLVVLHSGLSPATDDGWAAIGGLAPELLSVGLPEGYSDPALEFDSSRHRDARIGRRTDTSLKRNLALLIGRSLGWRRLLFLDDDVHGITPADVEHASGALDAASATGFHVDDFPDRSVVSHACRIAGTAPLTFVSGGALIVDPGQPASFFPTVYNEDWLFLYEWTRMGRVGSAGYALQLAYKPFDHPARAYGEEFGDILAEGLHQLLYHGAESHEPDPGYWSGQLAARRDRIQDAARLIAGSGVPEELRSRIRCSLRAAVTRHASLRPESFTSYLSAWRADLRAWQARLDAVPAADSPAAAFNHFHLTPDLYLTEDATQPRGED